MQYFSPFRFAFKLVFVFIPALFGLVLRCIYTYRRFCFCMHRSICRSICMHACMYTHSTGTGAHTHTHTPRACKHADTQTRKKRNVKKRNGKNEQETKKNMKTKTTRAQHTNGGWPRCHVERGPYLEALLVWVSLGLQQQPDDILHPSSLQRRPPHVRKPYHSLYVPMVEYKFSSLTTTQKERKQNKNKLLHRVLD